MRCSEFSDGGSEASLEDVRQHHGIIKTQKQDDPDYLTLFEAHQRRLEDVGSPTPGEGGRVSDEVNIPLGRVGSPKNDLSLLLKSDLKNLFSLLKKWELRGKLSGIYVFNRRATGFHRRGKVFQLNFVKRKTFRPMVKPGKQNHPPNRSICLVPHILRLHIFFATVF